MIRPSCASPFIYTALEPRASVLQTYCRLAKRRHPIDRSLTRGSVDPQPILLTRPRLRRSCSPRYPVGKDRLADEERESGQEEPAPERLAALLVFPLESQGAVPVERVPSRSGVGHHLD